jgi:hypothetical protein
MVLLVLAGAFVSLLLTRPWQTIRHTLVPYSGLIAASTLVCLQGISYLTLRRGSVYAVTKYTYLLALEVSVLVVSVRQPFMDGMGRFLRQHSSWASIGCVIVFFGAQGPFIATPYNQTLLMKVRDRLLDLGITYNPQHPVYPQFSAFDYDRNYYLAISVMRIPRDDRTNRWLLGGAVGEEAFTWPTSGPFGRPPLGEDPAMSVAPSKYYGYTAHLTPAEGKQLAPMTFQMRRPDILTVNINAPYQQRFKLATSIPAPKGFVILGYRTFDKASKPIEEGRSLLIREGSTWHARIRLSRMPPSLGAIEFSPVHEYITWFYWQQQPNISRLVFVD